MGICILKSDGTNYCFEACQRSDKNYCLCDGKKENNVIVIISSGENSSKNLCTNEKSSDNIVHNNTIVKYEQQQETDNKNYMRNKYRSKFFNKNNYTASIKGNKNLMSDFNATLSNESTMTKIIRIQTIFRGFLAKKKISTININNKNSENDSENENCSIENENTLIYNKNLSWTNYSNMSTDSNIEISPKKNTSNLKENNLITSYNLKSKNNMKYRYIGYVKKNPHEKNNSFVSINHDVKITKNFIKNGFGKIIFDDKSEFKSIFTNDKSDNYSIYKDIKNNEYFQGMYKNNTSNGFGIFTNLLNTISTTGYFKSNGINGIGIEESEINGYSYYGEFNKNLKHGFGTLQWNDGIIYQGQFNKNQMTGYGLIKFNNNEYYQGQVNNGKMDGYGEFFWKNGKRYFGEYKNDQREGFGIFIWNENDFNKNININIKDKDNLSMLNNGSVYIGFWSEGKMNGLGMKINCREIKYGLWKKGVKEKWIEDSTHIKYYLNNNQKKYLKILNGAKQKIIDLIYCCLTREHQTIDLGSDFNE